MIEFLRENLSTIIVGLIVFTVVALIIVNMIKDRKKGKSSCGCGCANCPSSGACHSK